MPATPLRLRSRLVGLSIVGLAACAPATTPRTVQNKTIDVAATTRAPHILTARERVLAALEHGDSGSSPRVELTALAEPFSRAPDVTLASAPSGQKIITIIDEPEVGRVVTVSR